jgi:hypothetical protein
LKKTDWPAIDYYLSKRKRDGKENEVLLDGVPIPPRKIQKEILRNSSAFPSKYSGEGKQFFTVDGPNGENGLTATQRQAQGCRPV